MTRIQQLHRGPLREENFNLSLGSIYQYRELLNIDYIPEAEPNEHTMFESLDEYVNQKLPVAEILKTMQFGGTLEVHAIYPKHFELAHKKEIVSHELQEIEFYHRPTTRKYNVVRPRFFIHRTRQKFIVCVAPGSDYIKHYGTMIRRLTKKNNLHANLRLEYYDLNVVNGRSFYGIDIIWFGDTLL